MTRDLRSRVDHWRNIAAQDDTRRRQDDPRRRPRHPHRPFRPFGAHRASFFSTSAARRCRRRGWVTSIPPACVPPTSGSATATPILWGRPRRSTRNRLLRLPDSQWCYLPVFDVPSAPARDPRSPERVVFGSFNHASKLSDRCIDLWCRVLHAVPGSVIRVFAVPPGQRDGGAPAAIRTMRGIDAGRLPSIRGSSIDAYFAAIGDVDIALDTFPYNGGTTTFDVLWMQVPLVALAGDRPAARSGVSILATLGSARTDRRRRRRLRRHQRPAGHRRRHGATDCAQRCGPGCRRRR